MSDEEEYEEGEEEEEEEEPEEEIKKDSGPNLNEFAQYEKYGNYYKHSPFSYGGSMFPQNTYNPNFIQQQYRNQYPYQQSSFQCLQQPSHQLYNRDGYGYSPHRPQVQQYGNHPKNQNNKQNQRFQSGLNLISDQVNQINNFASQIPYGTEDLPVRDKEFEEYLRLKKKFQIEQDRYRAGRQIAREDHGNPEPQNWGARIDEKVSQSKYLKTNQLYNDDEYKEFLEFQRFKMMRSQKQNEIPESAQKLNTYRKPRVEEPIIDIVQQRRQSIDRDHQAPQNLNSQQEAPPVFDIKPKTAKDLYKRKTGLKQVPEVNMVKIDPEQQKEIDEAIRVLLQK